MTRIVETVYLPKTKRINNLHKMVSYFLRERPELRNDDIELQIALISHKRAYDVLKQDGKRYIAVSALREFTQDNVKRVRAKIQNEEGLYLPTDPLVRKARGVKEEEWLRWVRSQEKPMKYWNDTDKDEDD